MLLHLLMVVPLALLLYLPGWATLLALGRRAGDGVSADAAGSLFVQVGMGLAVGGAVALVLALAGAFSGLYWSLAVLAWTIVALVLARPRLSAVRETLPLRFSLFKPDLVVLAVMLLALAVFLLPFMNVFGQSDEGAYPNIAVHIKNQGSVTMTDTVMSRMDPSQRELFYYTEQAPPTMRKIQEPGYFVQDFSKGTLVPQFVFFYPALMAVFMAFLGNRAGFAILPFFAVLSVLGMYLVGRELAGRAAGLIGALLLSVTFLQVYFSKYSSAEMAAQFFFLFGIFALMKYRGMVSGGEKDAPLLAYGACAGAGFTCMMLSHIESFFILAPLVVVVLTWFALGGLAALWDNRHFLTLVSAGVAVAVFTAFNFSYRYSEVNIRATAERLPGGWWSIAAGMAALVAVAIVLRWPLGGVRRFLLARKKWILLLVAIALVGVTVYAWFVRPTPTLHLGPTNYSLLNSSNFPRLAFYLTPLGVVLAVAGYCLFITRRLDTRTLVVPACGLFFSAIFIYRVFANPQLVYSMRRFVPVVVPVALLMVAYLAAELGDLGSRRWRPALNVLASVLVIGLVVWSAALSVHIFKISQMRDSLPAVHRVSDIAAEPAVIVCDQRAAHLLTAPLRTFFGRDVAGIRGDVYLNSPKFDDFLRSLKDKGAYYVTTKGNAEVLDGRFELEKVGVVDFTGKFLNVTYEKPTTETVTFNVQFSLYRVAI
jgi:hypothetical protein